MEQEHAHQKLSINVESMPPDHKATNHQAAQAAELNHHHASSDIACVEQEDQQHCWSHKYCQQHRCNPMSEKLSG